tara:strand:+ start:18190 stop:19257 length:1068 start_codon:yes stop_codon:yes gene_type:complete
MNFDAILRPNQKPVNIVNRDITFKQQSELNSDEQKILDEIDTIYKYRDIDTPEDFISSKLSDEFDEKELKEKINEYKQIEFEELERLKLLYYFRLYDLGRIGQNRLEEHLIQKKRLPKISYLKKHKEFITKYFTPENEPNEAAEFLYKKYRLRDIEDSAPKVERKIGTIVHATDDSSYDESVLNNNNFIESEKDIKFDITQLIDLSIQFKEKLYYSLTPVNKVNNIEVDISPLVPIPKKEYEKEIERTKDGTYSSEEIKNVLRVYGVYELNSIDVSESGKRDIGAMHKEISSWAIDMGGTGIGGKPLSGKERRSKFSMPKRQRKGVVKDYVKNDHLAFHYYLRGQFNKLKRILGK